ncbi:hypothetical protein MAR_013763, partial [Mya arenaria]
GTYVFISSETCGSSFYIDPDESLDVVYEGGSVSTDDEDGCYVQLNNKHSPQKTICFDEVSMDIDILELLRYGWLGLVRRERDSRFICETPNDTSGTLTPDKSESGSNHAPTIWIVGPRNPQCAQPSAVQYSGNTNYNLVPNAYPQTVHVNSYTSHMPPSIPHMQSASLHMSRDSPHTPLVSPSAPPIDLYARTMQPQHFDESAPPTYEQCMKNAKMS